ncbi:MAG: hypothetical protein WCO56_21030 [Verrucomicrobiota bacterium]
MVIFAGGAAFTTRQDMNLARLERQLRELQHKLDALIKHHGVEVPSPPPSGLSPEVERMAKDPSQKIAAIKLYREENPGVGLAEAKARIEEFHQNSR